VPCKTDFHPFRGPVFFSGESDGSVSAWLSVTTSVLWWIPSTAMSSISIGTHHPVTEAPQHNTNLRALGLEDLGVNGIEDEAVTVVPAVFRGLREYMSLLTGPSGA
jgi:hypothetical protein